ncbi:unnamed protein product [Taenia asiatica]|uniref:Rap-GAP domain-containing protein n=1 Tax=Taenia asiatica TaxID=60517 RepID=A0A158R7V7_TAEAS|nr:unnamed protein product [Taenia asiatica]
MAYIYRNNAGRFRLEPGVHTFLAPTASAPARNASVGVTSTSSSSSSWRPAQWFFSGPVTVGSRKFLLKNSALQESCPSINLLASGGAQNAVTTLSALRKPHSSSAPNEGITCVEPTFSPSTHMLRMLKKKNASKRLPSLAGDGPVHLENPERETRWYFKYFLGKAHQIYCGNISEKDPLLLAIVKSEFEAEGLRQYRAILWTNLFDIYRLEKGLKEILHYEVQKEALTLEEQEGSVNFKFGVLYCKEGQKSDEEMYSNGKNAFYLATGTDHIDLRTLVHCSSMEVQEAGTTGTESIYTIYEGHEIMFHVSTLLPITTDNRQQIFLPSLRTISSRMHTDAETKHNYSWRCTDKLYHYGNIKADSGIQNSFYITGKVLLACVDGGVYALEASASKGFSPVMHIIEHQQPLLLIAKSVDVKQIKVAESIGVMIIRYDKGRESRISVLQLSDLPLEEVIDRALVKKHMLDRSKGEAINHSISKLKASPPVSAVISIRKQNILAHSTRPLRLVFAVGKRLLIYQWQVEITGRSLSSWNQFTYSELSARFVFVREVPTSEAVQVLSILDSNMGGRICAGYRNQFDLLDERTGETLHLYRTENIKSQAIAVEEMRSDDDLELLLCFNRNCYLQRITKRSLPSHNHSDVFITCPSLEGMEHQFTDGFSSAGSATKSSVTSGRAQTAATTDYNFSWNFEPKHIVLAPPYILAFTESAIEFRLLINGSLVHTMTVPNCLLLSSKATKRRPGDPKPRILDLSDHGLFVYELFVR